MEEYILDKDIHVFCITASSFPSGVLDAHQRLHSMFSSPGGRTFFGISRPDRSGQIVYKAAVEENYPGEGKKYSCESFTIKEGRYISVLIENFTRDITSIAKTFAEMIADPRIDPQGACIEMYLSMDDVRCLVRLAS